MSFSTSNSQTLHPGWVGGLKKFDLAGQRPRQAKYGTGVPEKISDGHRD
jgi:hypothetical protein